MIEILMWSLAVAVIVIVSTESNWGGYLLKSDTDSLKGIAAILIVIHHLSKDVVASGPLSILKYIGIIMVGVFYFVSGYGCIYGLEKKEDYLKTFLRKRILAVMTPYWILLITKLVIDEYVGDFHDLREIILSLFGLNYITNTWFVPSILIMYFAFWFSFSWVKRTNQKNRSGIILLTLEIAAYTIVCTLIGLPSCYTASVLCFLVGIVFYYLKDGFIAHISAHYYKHFIVSIICFLLLFLGRLVIAQYGWLQESVMILFRNIVCVAFIYVLLVLVYKIQFKGAMIGLLASISYELYIAHSVMLELLRNDLTAKIGYTSIIICSSVALAMAVHYVTRKLRRIQFIR